MAVSAQLCNPWKVVSAGRMTVHTQRRSIAPKQLRTGNLSQSAQRSLTGYAAPTCKAQRRPAHTRETTKRDDTGSRGTGFSKKATVQSNVSIVQTNDQNKIIADVHSPKSEDPSSEKSKNHKEFIKEQRQYQLDASYLLGEMFKAADPVAFADENVENLNEGFFQLASFYLSSAKKEGNVEVSAKIEKCLRIAGEAKNRTLRPEIQLFNKLFQAKSAQERQVIYEADMTCLFSDDYYFQRLLLPKFEEDVKRQKDSPNRKKVLAQLRSINKEVNKLTKG